MNVVEVVYLGQTLKFYSSQVNDENEEESSFERLHFIKGITE